MCAVCKHTDNRWLLLYIERWLKAPVQAEDGTLLSREKGPPQGSVISPLLANLFLHYAFDEWMRRNYESIPLELYADDILVHCRSEKQARWIKTVIFSRVPLKRPDHPSQNVNDENTLAVWVVWHQLIVLKSVSHIINVERCTYEKSCTKVRTWPKNHRMDSGTNKIVLCPIRLLLASFIFFYRCPEMRDKRVIHLFMRASRCAFRSYTGDSFLQPERAILRTWH